MNPVFFASLHINLFCMLKPHGCKMAAAIVTITTVIQARGKESEKR